MSDEKKITPETRLRDIHELTPEEAAVVFGSKYDAPINALRGTLVGMTDFSEQDMEDMLNSSKALLEKYVSVPGDMTVGESSDLVRISDLLVLGELSYQLFARVNLFGSDFFLDGLRKGDS